MGLCASKPKDFGQFTRGAEGNLGIEHYIYSPKSQEDAAKRCEKVDQKLFKELRQKGRTSVGTPPDYSGFSQNR